jgi:hypothetical protein
MKLLLPSEDHCRPANMGHQQVYQMDSAVGITPQASIIQLPPDPTVLVVLFLPNMALPQAQADLVVILLQHLERSGAVVLLVLLLQTDLVYHSSVVTVVFLQVQDD